MDRRSFLQCAAGAGIAVQATDARAEANSLPFVHPVTNWPDENIVALCYPAIRCDRDSRYLMADGSMVRVDTFTPFRVNDGSGWREAHRATLEADLIGRVISLHRQRGQNWESMGEGWDV